MRNITIIIVISLIATILIVNTNYVFAKKQDLSQENKDTGEDCKGSDRCTIESQQDLSHKKTRIQTSTQMRGTAKAATDAPLSHNSNTLIRI
jgi:hypothetical protein